jgi:hypothetical protein
MHRDAKFEDVVAAPHSARWTIIKQEGQLDHKVVDDAGDFLAASLLCGVSNIEDRHPYR